MTQGSPAIVRPPDPAGDDLLIIQEADAAVREATEALETMDFRKYAFTVRHFLWDRFCSWYLEAAKSRLYADDPAAAATLMWTLDTVLRLMHPLAPFITERIRRAYSDRPLITDAWPAGQDVPPS